MSDIALIDKDIKASNFGDILILNDDDDIVQMAVNNILTIFTYDQSYVTAIGNQVYNGRYKMSANGLKEIANKCKDAIMSDNRVANVVEIIAENVSTQENYGSCKISFVLITVYGMQLSSSTIISTIS